MSNKKKRNKHNPHPRPFNELPDDPADFPEASASIEELSKETGYPPDEVRAALRQLKSFGMIDTPTIPKSSKQPARFKVFRTPDQATWWQSLKARALSNLTTGK